MLCIGVPLVPPSWEAAATAVAGVPGDSLTFYGGTATGGLHKTTNGGTTFEAIFDDVGVPSIGAIAIAPSDHNVVWVGTGEGNPGNSASIGRGVYRSVDAGETWTSWAWATPRRSRASACTPPIPTSPTSRPWDTNGAPTRNAGVYRTMDGGRRGHRILWVDESTGAADLAMDPENPRILYAAMYDFPGTAWHVPLRRSRQWSVPERGRWGELGEPLRPQGRQRPS